MGKAVDILTEHLIRLWQSLPLLRDSTHDSSWRRSQDGTIF